MPLERRSQFPMSSGDRAALVALFRSTGGTRWASKDNWDTDDVDLSRWYGVQVNDDGRVVKLQLSYNNLKGPIPEAIGALSELKGLYLNGNLLTGSIPLGLGRLSQLQLLGLHNNKLVGPIPEALGSLSNLMTLFLHGNKLTGHIPETLGDLRKLQTLGLKGNKLTGPIPEALGGLRQLTTLILKGNKLTGSIPTGLGSLGKLQWLFLHDNQLEGPIPKALGALTELWILQLHNNKLTGYVPKELGALENLQELTLENNRLTGAIPTELGHLSALSKFSFRNTGSLAILSRGNNLTGGPAKGEGLDSWKARIRPKQETKQPTLKVEQKDEDAPAPPLAAPPVLVPQQPQTGEDDEKEQDASVPLGSPNQKQEEVGEQVRSPEHGSLSPEKAEEMDRLFKAHLSSSAGLDSLIRDNPEAMEDLQRVIEAQVAGSFHADDELGDVQSRRKLGTLVTMSAALGEVVLRHTESMDVQQKELALAPFWKAYYTAVRSGLCEAYLAASVIGSDWVATSETGGMGKAGAALNVMSSAVPVIGGLTGLAGKALQTGDHCLQTRRLVKITAIAPDAVECCSLARRLALELADGLRNDASATADDTDQVRVDTTEGMKGGSGFGRGADVLPEIMSEEDMFEYLLEEVASYESNDHGGKRFGKQHLSKLLKAIQRGCLDGLICAEQKIKVLLLEILPEADIRPASTSSTLKEVIVGSPSAVAPAHDSGLPSIANFAAMQAALEALTSAKDKQQAELEAIKADKEKQQEELKGLQAAKDLQQEELKAMGSANKSLQRQVKHLQKHVPELDCKLDDDVDCGGGLALRRRVAVTETAEGFLDRARDRAAAAADHHPVTVSQQREFEALQDEKHRDHEARFRELEGEISKATKRKGRR